MMARLFLSGIHGEGRHGARPGEKDNAQPFVVDLDLEVEVGSDRIDATADYRGVSERVRGIVEEGSFDLIETMAAEIADACLAFPAVRASHGRRAQAERGDASGDRRCRSGGHAAAGVAE